MLFHLLPHESALTADGSAVPAVSGAPAPNAGSRDVQANAKECSVLGESATGQPSTAPDVGASGASRLKAMAASEEGNVRPLYLLGMTEPETSLQQELLFALGNGMETTLLVLEMVSDTEVGPVPEEAAVLQELAIMEAAGLVSRQTQPGPGKPEPGVGIPEHEQGRAQVLWWGLTEAGEVRAREEWTRRGWS